MADQQAGQSAHGKGGDAAGGPLAFISSYTPEMEQEKLVTRTLQRMQSKNPWSQLVLCSQRARKEADRKVFDSLDHSVPARHGQPKTLTPTTPAQRLQGAWANRAQGGLDREPGFSPLLGGSVPHTTVGAHGNRVSLLDLHPFWGVARKCFLCIAIIS